MTTHIAVYTMDSSTRHEDAIENVLAAISLAHDELFGSFYDFIVRVLIKASSEDDGRRGILSTEYVEALVDVGPWSTVSEADVRQHRDEPAADAHSQQFQHPVVCRVHSGG